MRAFFLSVCVASGAACCPAEELEPLTNEMRSKLTNSVGMRLVAIPAGRFVMGSPASEPGRRERETQREVEIAPFYLGECETTQAQFEAVMQANPSAFAAGGARAEKVAGRDTGDFPVESVTWAQATEFCRRLSELPCEKAGGRIYRLPTEAEWEYACRAGTTGPFHFGDDASKLGEFAWIAENSENRPHAVGARRPNRWALHDTYGNVWEWCADEYVVDASRSGEDDAAPVATTMRVIRGGGFASWIPARMRSAARNFDPEAVGDADTGFRVAMEIVERD